MFVLSRVILVLAVVACLGRSPPSPQKPPPLHGTRPMVPPHGMPSSLVMPTQLSCKTRVHGPWHAKQDVPSGMPLPSAGEFLDMEMEEGRWIRAVQASNEGDID